MGPKYSTRKYRLALGFASGYIVSDFVCESDIMQPKFGVWLGFSVRVMETDRDRDKVTIRDRVKVEG